MRFRGLIVLSLSLLLVGIVQPGSQAMAPANKAAFTRWQGLKAKWKSINNFSAELFSWGYQTNHFIKNFPERLNQIPPEKKDSEPPPIQDWRYRVYHLQFLKPDFVQITYKKSLREDTERGSIINKAVALVLKHVPGTQLNYGWYKTFEYMDGDRKRTVHGLTEALARKDLHPNLKSVKLTPKNYSHTYVKFPMISDGKFSEIPVPFLYKGAMKIMMYASRSEIYRKSNDMLMDSRGFGVKDVAINRVMDRYEHFFNSAKVTIEPAPQFVEADYKLNAQTGWLSIKNPTKAKTVQKIVMIPNDFKKSRGITRMECFFDPKTNVVLGIHEFENHKLVGVMIFQNVKINDPAVKKTLWENYFKGRKISEQS